MKLRQIPLLLLGLAAPLSSLAQEQKLKPIRLKVEARGEYDYEKTDGKVVHENTGLRGNIVDFKLEGDISRHFSYTYRQRLNTINKDSSYFDSTDWLYLRYAPTDNWSFMAGKWVVLTGGWEFDPPPIDCFQLCEFCYNYPCYQWGALVNYVTTDKRNSLMFQVTQSPFRKAYQEASGQGAQMYAYGLIWNGTYGIYKSVWSLNLVERTPGHYMNMIGLGNRFNFGEKIEWDVDFVNRYCEGQSFLFKDFSVMSRFCYKFSRRFNVFAKISYDTNKSGTPYDTTVMDGTEITRVGAGFELYPLKTDMIRVHGNYSYSFGTNTNENGYLKDKQSLISVGLTWQMKIL